MTASPLGIQNGTAGTVVSTARATALAVRTNSMGTTQGGYRASVERGPELAEQLNEKTKEKYVKGAPDHASFLLPDI